MLKNTFVPNMEVRVLLKIDQGGFDGG